jgi:hypothetical protein
VRLQLTEPFANSFGAALAADRSDLPGRTFRPSAERRNNDSAHVNQLNLKKEGPRVDVTYTDVIRAYFRGRSALQQPDDVFVPLFDELTADALKKGLPVHLHFEELEFFNSATISSVIQCILAMKDKGVRTMLRYDGRQKWQKLFFEPLAMLRGGDLEVRAV